MVLKQKYYPRPLCLQKPYMMYDDKITSENAIKQSKELITLPVHQYLNKHQLKFMVSKISEFYKSH